jgi:hypothetical protein
MRHALDNILGFHLSVSSGLHNRLVQPSMPFYLAAVV